MNFITAHDGFTLRDLVSYNDKHNDANGEGNRDGHSDNRSNNYGEEGPTENPDLRELRLRQMRNFIGTLMLSRGTPMLLAGDEFARTQGGNNNAYAQDSEIGWIDWKLDPEGRALAEFTQKMIILRQALPMLRRGRFLTGQFDEAIGGKDATWLSPSGQEMTDQNWSDANARCFGVLLDGRAQPTGLRRPGTDATLLFVLNAYHDVVTFTLPEAPGGQEWVCLVDTNQPELEAAPNFPFGHSYDVTGRSMLLFMLRPERGGSRDAVRSFRHVMAEYEKAIAEAVVIPG